MSRNFGGAALLIALLAAPSAHAQRLVAEPVLGPPRAGPPPPAIADAQASVSREIFRSGAPVGVATRSYTEVDGSTSRQRGLIGNWSVRRNLEAGIGLFSVTGDSRKNAEYRRDWSAKQVTPRNQNIAAVGMRLKF